MHQIGLMDRATGSDPYRGVTKGYARIWIDPVCFGNPGRGVAGCSIVANGLCQGFPDLYELGPAVDFKTKHILDVKHIDGAFAKG